MRGLLRGRTLRWVGLGLVGLVLVAAINNDDQPRPAAPAVVTVEAQESAPIEPPEIVLPSNAIPNAVDAIDDAQRLARANRPAAARRRLADIPADAMTNQRIRRRANPRWCSSPTSAPTWRPTPPNAGKPHRRARFSLDPGISRLRSAEHRGMAAHHAGIALRSGRAGRPQRRAVLRSNYAGACVPRYPPDVNCADVGVTVTVVGSTRIAWTVTTTATAASSAGAASVASRSTSSRNAPGTRRRFDSATLA